MDERRYEKSVTNEGTYKIDGRTKGRRKRLERRGEGSGSNRVEKEAGRTKEEERRGTKTRRRDCYKSGQY